MIRVLLVEDHETVRAGLRLLVDAQDDMEVVGEAGDGRAALERTAALHPDVVVLDLTMPGVSGLAAARALRSVAGVAVVVLTRHNDEAYVQELKTLGAAGYVLKQSPSSQLLHAIRAASGGGYYIDPAAATTRSLDARGRETSPRITSRECAVLRRMAEGQSNKEIAATLGISVKTVEVHKTNAMRKLSLHGRADVVRYAVLSGWLQDP